jgi:hypothetical protein
VPVLYLMGNYIIIGNEETVEESRSLTRISIGWRGGINGPLNVSKSSQ